jgi:spermidine/putrescine transport system permease protein
MAIAVTVICLVVSILSYLLTKLPHSIQQVMLVLVILPFWSNYLLRVCLDVDPGERGLINRGLMSLGILDTPVRFLLCDSAVIIVAVYLYIPIARSPFTRR